MVKCLPNILCNIIDMNLSDNIVTLQPIQQFTSLTKSALSRVEYRKYFDYIKLYYSQEIWKDVNCAYPLAIIQIDKLKTDNKITVNYNKCNFTKGPDIHQYNYDDYIPRFGYDKDLLSAMEKIDSWSINNDNYSKHIVKYRTGLPVLGTIHGPDMMGSDPNRVTIGESIKSKIIPCNYLISGIDKGRDVRDYIIAGETLKSKTHTDMKDKLAYEFNDLNNITYTENEESKYYLECDHPQNIIRMSKSYIWRCMTLKYANGISINMLMYNYLPLFCNPVICCR